MGHVPPVDMGEYVLYESQFVTRDTGIMIEKKWYAPQGGFDSYRFLVQAMRIYALDGQTHSGLTIGEVADWDIPADTAVRNRSGFYMPKRLVYQYGSEYNQDDDVECQENSERYGGVAVLEILEIDGIDTTCTEDFYGAYTEDNSTFVYPAGGFVPRELDSAMTANEGYVIESEIDTDLHTVVTYKEDYTLIPTKVVEVYTLVATSRFGYASFISTIEAGHQWYLDNLRPEVCGGGEVYPCGDYTCDNWVDISDLVAAYDLLHLGGSPSNCPDYADCDDHSLYSFRDLAMLVRSLYNSGPRYCPPTQPAIDGPVQDSIYLHTFESSYLSADYFPAGDSSYAVHVHFTTDRTIDIASLPFHIRVSTEIPIIDSVIPHAGGIGTREFFAQVDEANTIIGAASVAYNQDLYFEPGTYEVATIYLTMAAQDSVWRPILVGWDSLPPIQQGRRTHYPYVTEPDFAGDWTPSLYRLPCLQPIRGDMDYNGEIDIADLVHLVDYMFSGGCPPRCFEEADVADDGLLQLDISDLVYLVDYMFTGGPPPPPCPEERALDWLRGDEGTIHHSGQQGK